MLPWDPELRPALVQPGHAFQLPQVQLRHQPGQNPRFRGSHACAHRTVSEPVCQGANALTPLQPATTQVFLHTRFLVYKRETPPSHLSKSNGTASPTPRVFYRNSTYRFLPFSKRKPLSIIQSRHPISRVESSFPRLPMTRIMTALTPASPLQKTLTHFQSLLPGAVASSVLFFYIVFMDV